MRKAASIARGACSEISDPSTELMTRSKLMIPSPSVTGSMSLSVWMTRGSRQSKPSLSRKSRRASAGKHMASCTIVPISTPIA